MENCLETDYSYSSSLSQDNFLDIDSITEFICPICQGVPKLEEATEIQCCNHIYCYNCITQWLEQKSNCALCKANILFSEKDKQLKKLKDGNKSLFRVMNGLKVKCFPECNWEGKLSEYESHYKKCPFKKYNCKYSKYGCKYIGKIKEIEDHENNEDKIHLKILYDYIQKEEKEKKSSVIINVTCHSHPLVLTYNPYDYLHGDYLCNKGNEGDKACPYKKERIRDIPSFHCSLCEYDLCSACALRFLEK